MERDPSKKITKRPASCELTINMFLMNSRASTLGELLANNTTSNSGEHAEKIGKEGEGMDRRGEFQT